MLKTRKMSGNNPREILSMKSARVSSIFWWCCLGPKNAVFSQVLLSAFDWHSRLTISPPCCLMQLFCSTATSALSSLNHTFPTEGEAEPTRSLSFCNKTQIQNYVNLKSAPFKSAPVTRGSRDQTLFRSKMTNNLVRRHLLFLWTGEKESGKQIFRKIITGSTTQITKDCSGRLPERRWVRWRKQNNKKIKGKACRQSFEIS